MRAVVQRVTSSCVISEGKPAGSIGYGMTVLLGISRNDTASDADYIVKKLSGLRIFDDENGVMNLNLFQYTEFRDGKDKKPEILVVSQFTLYGDARKGNRPSYIMAEEPEKANILYKYTVNKLSEAGFRVETGVFRTDMNVEIHNDGPVTILLDSEKIL